MRFTFGMPVADSDGEEAGSLDLVIVDPQRREVLHAVVRTPRISEEVLVPLHMIEGDVGDRLQLQVPGEELTDLPRYYEGRSGESVRAKVDTSQVPPPERRQELEEALGIPDDAREYGPDTRVVTADGHVGHLTAVDTQHGAEVITVVRAAGLAEGELTVAAEWIGDLGESEIALDVPRERLGRGGAPPSATYLGERPSGPS
ncbi:PRC-barrel domain-containing protein [Myxococcota bacterium]|nr:PRC-barrel domain-containing protein [Myxococcota bacterium]